MEVLYHIRPYFAGIFPYIGLIYGRYLQFRILKFTLISQMVSNWVDCFHAFELWIFCQTTRTILMIIVHPFEDEVVGQESSIYSQLSIVVRSIINIVHLATVFFSLTMIILYMIRVSSWRLFFCGFNINILCISLLLGPTFVAEDLIFLPGFAKHDFILTGDPLDYNYAYIHIYIYVNIYIYTYNYHPGNTCLYFW